MTLTAADRELVRRAVDEAKRRDLARGAPNGPPERIYERLEDVQPFVDEALPVRDELVGLRRRVAELQRENTELRSTVALKNLSIRRLSVRLASMTRSAALSAARRDRIKVLERRLRTVQRLLDEVSR